MAASSYRTVLPLLAAATLAYIPGCAASSLSVRFDAYQSPLPGFAGEDGTISFVGFNGIDLALNNLTGYLFVRAMVSDSTLPAIQMRPVLRTLARHPHEAGRIPDSLALVVGREMSADITLIGDLERAYTEEYGEVKVFREEEAIGVGLGRSDSRFINKAYVLPHIDQTAVVTAALRAYSIRSNTLIADFSFTESETYRTVLPEPVEAPPEGAISVEFVSPMLTEVLARRVVDRLMAVLSPERIQVTRRLIDTRDGRAISAARAGDWSRAVTIWEGIVAEDPYDAAAWNNLAVAYERSGRRTDAAAAYRSALSARPRDRTIRANERAFGLAADDSPDR